MLSSACLVEEGVEGIITSPDGLVGWHLAVWLNTMFKAVQLPTSVADLYASLSNMN